MKTVMLVAFLAVVMFQTALVSGATTDSATATDSWDSGASTTMVSVMALLLPVVAALFRLQ